MGDAFHVQTAFPRLLRKLLSDNAPKEKNTQGGYGHGGRSQLGAGRDAVGTEGTHVDCRPRELAQVDAAVDDSLLENCVRILQRFELDRGVVYKEPGRQLILGNTRISGNRPLSDAVVPDENIVADRIKKHRGFLGSAGNLVLVKSDTLFRTSTSDNGVDRNCAPIHFFT
jgi:hypothetical protein